MRSPQLMIGTLRAHLLSRVPIYSVSLGTGTRVALSVHISRKNDIALGRRCYVGPECWLGANVQIGDDVLIGPRVAFVGGDHRIPSIPSTIRDAGRDVLRTTVIGDDVWLGYGAIIMHGITIASHAVVAAGAVVTRNVEEGAIVGGTPASVISWRGREA